MAIEGFDYKGFAEELSSQAVNLLPKNFQDFQRNYVVNTIKNFATLCGEALNNEENSPFTLDQAMLMTQIIAEWSFHKSVDTIRSGIMPDHWDGIMQKVAFTIFEISKQAILQKVSQDEILEIVEHHVKKAYSKAIEDLMSRNLIDEASYKKALSISNIDEMMQKIQEEKQQEQAQAQAQAHAQGQGQNQTQQADNSNTKILRLASVALLLKQMQQDKVQTILNKFNPQDAQAVIQYMQMPDLENKVDLHIAMKYLNEIKYNLPEPRHISSEKIIARVNQIFQKINLDQVETILVKERPNIKEFILKAKDGDEVPMPSKVANIILQHLEETIS